jgi:hypothetical protein
MKKYLGLIIFLGAALSLIPFVARGQDIGLETDPALEVDVRTLTPAEKRIQAEARLRAQKEEVEIKRIESRVKREILEGDIKARFQANTQLMTAGVGEDEATNSEIKITREEALKRMAELRASLKAEKNALKVKILEDRITGREKALERFDQAIERVENQKEKVEALIERFTAKGVETEKAVSLVTEADTKLYLAKEKTVEAHVLLSNSSEELTEEEKKVLQALSKEIQASIKTAHAKLNDAGKALKNAVSVRQTIRVEKSAE